MMTPISTQTMVLLTVQRELVQPRRRVHLVVLPIDLHCEYEGYTGRARHSLPLLMAACSANASWLTRDACQVAQVRYHVGRPSLPPNSAHPEQQWQGRRQARTPGGLERIAVSQA